VGKPQNNEGDAAENNEGLNHGFDLRSDGLGMQTLVISAPVVYGGCAMLMIIRPARESDFHALNHIRESAVRDSTAAGSALIERLHRWNPRRSYAKPAYWRNAFVAEVEGEVVGVAKTIGPMLKDLWVLQTKRSLGAGAALGRAAENAIRADGHRVAHLYTAAFNARTRAFYERNGWSMVRFTQHAVGHFRRCVYVKRL